jgi:hypothetical protein
VTHSRLVGPSAYPCAFIMPSRQRLETRNICVVHNPERRERELLVAPIGTKSSPPLQLNHIVSGRAPLYDTHDVFAPRIQGRGLFRGKIVALIHAHNAGAAA